jgi:tRNA threonylcarbamoyladenosine biosynthesis protein TsaB
MNALLAIDTTAGSTGVALAVDGEVRVSTAVVKAYGHSESLFPQIDEALKGVGIVPSQLGAVAVTQGPGSFTGLRVGIATAKGIAYGLKIPAVGVSSLRALAASIRGFDGIVLPLFDARKGQVYGAALDQGRAGEAVVEEGAWNPEELAERVFAIGRPCLALGSGIGTYREIFSRVLGDRLTVSEPSLWNINPTEVALLGAAEWKAGRTVPAGLLQPVYHRLSEAEENRRKDRLRTSP